MMTKSCLIVGAGMAGLTAAQVLHKAGVSVTLVDKGRGVGGRMATRRLEGAVCDHGAQYFTARDPRFVAQVEAWAAGGVVRPWATGFHTADGALKASGEPRYISPQGMTGVAKAWAAGLDVRLGLRVTRLVYEDTWQVTAETGENFNADALILTPPVPQSLALLAESVFTLPVDVQQALEAVRYQPCYALMLTLEGPSQVPPPGGLWLDGEPIAWVADQAQKGISPVSAVVAHSGPRFAETHWNTPDEEVTALMLEALRPWLGTAVLTTSLHRWRYSQPTHLHSAPTLGLDAPAPLFFAGDAFAGPRVEGAFLSGLAAAEGVLAAWK
jgi:predicted NAD/FAD-dependent oxidoreductase